MNTTEYKFFISDCKKVIEKTNKDIDIRYDIDDVNFQNFNNYANARKKAANLRQKNVNHIDELLVLFEKKFNENGGKVNYSLDYDSLSDDIIKILREKKNKRSKSF